MAAAQIAARLRDAEARGQAIAPIRDELGAVGVATAYAIQELNTGVRLAAGERLVGRKVGLTSKAVQIQLGVDQPDFGMLFDGMEIAEGTELDLSTLIQPRVEAEIGFVLSRDITDPGISLRQVIAAVDCIYPCIEVVDSRITDWNIGILDTVADNASSGRFVVGAQPRRLEDFDLLHCGMALREDGHVRSTGAGAACLGNPAEALRWLARTLAETQYPLRAGNVILSGALGPMFPLTPGRSYLATIAGLGSVTLNTAGTRS